MSETTYAPLTPTTPSRLKSPSAFKTISEVAQDTGIAQHVLRFWEGKFIQLRPLKRGGGRRYYRPEDVALVLRIRRLLQEEGYSIKGVQKVLREQRPLGEQRPAARMPAPAPDAFPRTRAAMAGEGESQLVLDVESLTSASAREQLLQDVLEELRVLRHAIKD